MRNVLSALLILLFCVSSQPASSQATSAVELGGLLVALQQLKSTMESALATADQATAAKIRQSEIAVDATIAQVKSAMDHGYGLINNTRDQVMGDVATTLIGTQEIVQGDISTSLLGVNDSVANAARVLTGIPFVNVPTYIYAVTPVRFSVDSPSRHVEVHGFFPDVSKEHPVIVQFPDNSSVTLDSYINNTLGFDLPATLLTKESTFIEIAFELPVKHLWGLYYTSLPLKARVYVEKTKPFTFNIVISEGNPDLFATVVSQKPFELHANSEMVTNIQTFTPVQIFSQLINDNVTYDMNTAKFVGFSSNATNNAPVHSAIGSFLGGMITVSMSTTDPITQGVNPCASGCTASSGSWSWDSDTLRINLYAPSCGTHIISPGGWNLPYQCGGGTHADFSAFPTFSVARRNVHKLEVEAAHQQLVLGHKTVSGSLPLPDKWTSIEIRGKFEDGSERRENFVRLTSGDKGQFSANDPLYWNAQVTGQALILSTR